MARAARARTAVFKILAAAPAAVALAAAGCGGAPAHGTASTAAPAVIRVVAAESMWADIAAQLGGTRVRAVSIVSSPAADPRSYRPTAADRDAFSSAQLLILNGAGYDPWAGELANSVPGIRRAELNIGDNVGVSPGGNPYLWYDPGYVQEAAALIVGDYARIDPAGAAYFESRQKTFEDALVPYGKLVFKLKAAYPGTPVGASTPIAAPLASALGLRLVTPAPFLQAMFGGAGPAPADTAAASAQISSHKIRIYFYDDRSDSAAVRAQVAQAKAAGIPVVPLSAMLTPANATFQQWQAGTVAGVARALGAARSH